MANDEPTQDVLSSLPRTRPQRRSAKRDEVKAAAKTAPKRGAKPKRSAAAKPRPKAAPGKAAPAARSIPPAGFAPPEDSATRPAPSGVELLGTAIQAAGELAQIGLAIGGQALRSALGRGDRG